MKTYVTNFVIEKINDQKCNLTYNLSLITCNIVYQSTKKQHKSLLVIISEFAPIYF